MSQGDRPPYSLGLRLSWLFAAQTLIGFGVLSAAIYLVAALHLAAKADAELARKADLVMHLVEEAAGSGDMEAMRHKLNEFFVVHDDLQVTLMGPDGSMAFQSSGRIGTNAMQQTTTFELRGGAATRELASGTIVMDRSADARLLAGLAALLVVATLLGALAVSLSGFWVVRRSLAPLRGLADQTRALRIDRLDGERLTLSQPVEELQPWIEQFNALMGRLDYAYKQLEAFNADVAHELRTPLATLIGQTEVILSRTRTAGELQETLGSNLEEVRRLSLIVNDMLFLARADRGAVALAAPLADLSPQVGQVLEFYEGALAEAGVTARIEGEAGASFEPGLVRRAISNLLGNAIQYADPGSEIVVALRQADGQAWVVVRNAGAGLAVTAIPRIFDRFFRVQPSRQGSNENHGLGLAIVSAIARMHGGATCAASDGGVTSIGFSIASGAQRQAHLKTEATPHQT